eukprot:Hpha_TRINITY_DN14674_c0_g1::TRINITY_DN14674_c0_g1_i1::g.47978::m.47978
MKQGSATTDRTTGGVIVAREAKGESDTEGGAGERRSPFYPSPHPSPPLSAVLHADRHAPSQPTSGGEGDGKAAKRRGGRGGGHARDCFFDALFFCCFAFRAPNSGRIDKIQKKSPFTHFLSFSTLWSVPAGGCRGAGSPLAGKRSPPPALSFPPPVSPPCSSCIDVCYAGLPRMNINVMGTRRPCRREAGGGLGFPRGSAPPPHPG